MAYQGGLQPRGPVDFSGLRSGIQGLGNAAGQVYQRKAQGRAVAWEPVLQQAGPRGLQRIYQETKDPDLRRFMRERGLGDPEQNQISPENFYEGITPGQATFTDQYLGERLGVEQIQQQGQQQDEGQNGQPVINRTGPKPEPTPSNETVTFTEETPGVGAAPFSIGITVPQEVSPQAQMPRVVDNPTKIGVSPQDFASLDEATRQQLETEGQRQFQALVEGFGPNATPAQIEAGLAQAQRSGGALPQVADQGGGLRDVTAQDIIAARNATGTDAVTRAAEASATEQVTFDPSNPDSVRQGAQQVISQLDREAIAAAGDKDAQWGELNRQLAGLGFSQDQLGAGQNTFQNIVRTAIGDQLIEGTADAVTGFRPDREYRTGGQDLSVAGLNESTQTSETVSADTRASVFKQRMGDIYTEDGTRRRMTAQSPAERMPIAQLVTGGGPPKLDIMGIDPIPLATPEQVRAARDIQAIADPNTGEGRRRAAEAGIKAALSTESGQRQVEQVIKDGADNPQFRQRIVAIGGNAASELSRAADLYNQNPDLATAQYPELFGPMLEAQTGRTNNRRTAAQARQLEMANEQQRELLDEHGDLLQQLELGKIQAEIGRIGSQIGLSEANRRLVEARIQSELLGQAVQEAMRDGLREGTYQDPELADAQNDRVELILKSIDRMLSLDEAGRLQGSSANDLTESLLTQLTGSIIGNVNIERGPGMFTQGEGPVRRIEQGMNQSGVELTDEQRQMIQDAMQSAY